MPPSPSPRWTQGRETGHMPAASSGQEGTLTDGAGARTLAARWTRGGAMGVVGMAEVGEWMTVDQAARELQVSDKTIRRWVAAGELPASRHGRTIRIRRADLIRRPSDSAEPAMPAKV